MENLKYRYFDEVHICMDSEYGCWFTVFDDSKGIYLLNQFCNEDDLQKVFEEILKKYDEEYKRKENKK